MNPSQIARRIYKISGICGRINLKQQRKSPTDSTDEHGYWVRRCFPQIAQMSTDIGIYKICEYLWNPWENQISSSRGNLPQISQINTDIGCEGEHKSL